MREVYGMDLDEARAENWAALRAAYTWIPRPKENQPAAAPAWTWWTAHPSNIIQLATA